MSTEKRTVRPTSIEALSQRDQKICRRILWILQNGKSDVTIRPDGFAAVTSVVRVTGLCQLDVYANLFQLSVHSLREERINLDYLRILVERTAPLEGLLELREEPSAFDSRLTEWYIRAKGWTDYPVSPLVMPTPFH